MPNKLIKNFTKLNSCSISIFFFFKDDKEQDFLK